MADEQHTTHAHDDHHAPADTEMREGQNINVPLVLTIGVVAAILLIVIVVGTQAWFHYDQQLEFQRKVVEQRNPQLVELNNEAQGRLRGRIEPAIQDIAQRYRAASEAERSGYVPVNPAATESDTANETDEASEAGDASTEQPASGSE